jgi:DNA-binding phage protein
MLLNLWLAALKSQVGISIQTDNRALLRQHLYRARAEAKDPKLDALLIVVPAKEDELWIVRKDADSLGTYNKGDVEPIL